MKRIILPVGLFNFDEPISKGLVSSLKLLIEVGYELFLIEIPNSFLEKILANEGIILKIVESSENDFIKIEIQKRKGQILLSLGKNRFDSIVELANELVSRKIFHSRKTKETEINIQINLDGKGISNIKSGIGFFDHMLEQIARHANIDLVVKAKGDLWVDEHHTIEDIGITLGEAIKIALGTKNGIKRYGFFIPMDDSVAVCSIDLGGRAYLNFNCKFNRDKIGEFPTELVKEFFRGLSQGLGANIFIKAKGENDHHKTESIFKCFAKALNEACRIDERNKGMIPTTKGII